MSETCDAPFDFFLHVVTYCGRPKGHTDGHYPIPFNFDLRAALEGEQQ